MHEELIKRLHRRADNIELEFPKFAELLREAADALSAPSHSERAEAVAQCGAVDVERSAFEAHMQDEFGHVDLSRDYTSDEDGEYNDRNVSNAWYGWRERAHLASAPAVPVRDGVAWDIANEIWAALDRRACPSAYMSVAIEAAVEAVKKRLPPAPSVDGEG